MKRLSKEDIIKETARFYNRENRGYDHSSESCAYLASNGNKCAVGRCILSKHINKVKKFDGGVNELEWYLNAEHTMLFEDALKEKYRGHDKDFWIDLQEFHDYYGFFDYDGLTSRGKERLETLLDNHKEK